MKILIVGSGGREHAILRQVLQSPKVVKVYVAPGNAGMAKSCDCIDISADNINALAKFASDNQIDLTIVGPELPLTLGIVDLFKKKGLAIFGPDQKASVLEGSKIFTKEFCKRNNIPTAPFATFDTIADARNYIKALQTYPIVIKADGLAGGKGVIIAESKDHALKAINEIMLDKKFGDAGSKLLIEDFLKGEEASFIVVCDGLNYIEFSSSQDHKKIFEQDKGPNTGGMGAYGPAPVVTSVLQKRVLKEIIEPTLKGMKDEGNPYTGFLYAGLMVDDKGNPQLIEYNCRLGDPEAEVILPLLKSDFISLIQHAVQGKLNQYQVSFETGSAVCVVLASKGYPGTYQKGFVITGIDKINDPNVFVYHSGTQKKDGHFVTFGGRVLTVTAKGADLQSAIKRVYDSVSKISWDGLYYRRDIGIKGLDRKLTSTDS